MTDDNQHTNTAQYTRIPKVSVIVPAYNAEPYIGKCLDSIFSQTFQNFEVIVVNDGSTDHTKQICEQYAALHQNMTIVNQKNGGIANARNTGLKICKGDYIAFSDSDDYVEIDWLQQFIDGINSHTNVDLTVQGLLVNYEDRINAVKINENLYTGHQIFDAYTYLKKRSIEGFLFNKLYKRSIIEKNNITFEYTLKEDLLFNLKYLQFASSAMTIPSACYHYVQHGSQSLIHKRYPADYMKDLITSLYEATMNLCDKCHASQLRNSIIEEYMLSFSVLLFSMYQKKTGIHDRKERIKYIKEYQKIRRSHQDIKIQMGSKVKQLFAKFMMLPPRMTDFFLNIIKL